MNISRYVSLATLTAAISFASTSTLAHTQGIQATKGVKKGISTSFDIIHAKVSIDHQVATFHMGVAEAAGNSKPAKNGKLAGSSVYSYVWPTTLDSASVGFESNAGILALAVTAHPDFDDTPLYDENADNDPNNDGDVWHSHWVVLEKNQHCGDGALGVVDIPKGSTPKLPKTWPGLPILLDSPGWDPVIKGDTVEVKVAFDSSVQLSDLRYDGVTAGLRVNQSVHAPLLCVVDVMDIASGDLSLPGKVSH